MSTVHLFTSVQKMPSSIEEAWVFFSHPKNLAVLTPEKLNLRFTNELYGDEMYPGQIIMYKVKPILGIPFFWMTEITHVEKFRFFVDEQRRGPYALWHHQHHFKAIEGGVEMTDLVHYQIPFSFIGSLALTFIKKQLDEIFLYRRKKIEELFGVL